VAATETRAAATRRCTGRRSARSWPASTGSCTCAHANEVSSRTRCYPCCPGTAATAAVTTRGVCRPRL
jgi:hypothetical protein